MAKSKPRRPSDDVPKRTFDDNAQTVYEIMAETGASYKEVCRLRDEMLAAGRWVRVWKRVGRNRQAAFLSSF